MQSLKKNSMKILTAAWNGWTTAATLTTNFGFGIRYKIGRNNVGFEKSKSDTREYVGANERRS